jgi:hypothetical protein
MARHTANIGMHASILEDFFSAQSLVLTAESDTLIIGNAAVQALLRFCI